MRLADALVANFYYIILGVRKYIILQRLLNAAARIVTGTRKYDRGLSVTSTAYKAALAGHPGAGFVQACFDGPPMSPGQGAAIAVELLRASL